MFYKTRRLETVFLKTTSVDAERTLCSVKSWSSLKAFAGCGEPLDCLRVPCSTPEDVDRELYRWCKIVDGLVPDTMPFTVAVLQQRARTIGKRLGVSGFTASPRFVRRWAAWHKRFKNSLWGTGESAASDVAAAHQRMAQLRKGLSAQDPDQIYSMDRAGLVFWCLPNRSYVTAGHLRRAGATKTMEDKDSMMLVLACNATGIHKIPVSILAMPYLQFASNPHGRRALYHTSAKSRRGWTPTSTNSGSPRF